MKDELERIKEKFRPKLKLALTSFLESSLNESEGNKWSMSVPFENWHVHFTNLWPGTSRMTPDAFYICLEDLERVPSYSEDYHCFNPETGRWKEGDEFETKLEMHLNEFVGGLSKLRTESYSMRQLGFKTFPEGDAQPTGINPCRRYYVELQVRGRVCKLVITRTLGYSPEWKYLTDSPEAVTMELGPGSISWPLNIGKDPVSCLIDYFKGEGWKIGEDAFRFEKKCLGEFTDLNPMEVFTALPLQMRMKLVEMKWI